MEKEDRKALGIIFTSALTLTLIVTALIFVYGESEPEGPFLTTTFKGVDKATTQNLMNTTSLTIIDCTGGCKPCNYKYHLPGAIWTSDPIPYYNSTQPILAYTSKGGDSNAIKFCEQLVNHTYGELCYLVGGYNAWVS